MKGGFGTSIGQPETIRELGYIAIMLAQGLARGIRSLITRLLIL